MTHPRTLCPTTHDTHFVRSGRFRSPVPTRDVPYCRFDFETNVPSVGLLPGLRPVPVPRRFGRTHLLLTHTKTSCVTRPPSGLVADVRTSTHTTRMHGTFAPVCQHRRTVNVSV